MLDNTKWFGIRLGETSKIILFYFALIGVIETPALLLSIIGIIEFIYYGMPIESILREIIMMLPRIILLPIFCYTLSICIKFKKVEKEFEDSYDASFQTTKLFGLLLSQKSGIIICFVALIGIPSVIPSLYFYVILLRDYIQSLLYGGNWIRMLGLLGISQLLSALITKLVIYSYSIVKFAQVKKNINR